MTLVDTNVLLDIVTDEPDWRAWSLRELKRAELRGPLRINAVVFAEFSVRFADIEGVEAKVAQFGLTIADIPRPALFLAGKAFQAYRRAGGQRTGVLADFFIGAHAIVEGWTLLTRDPRQYRRYFPSIDLICP